FGGGFSGSGGAGGFGSSTSHTSSTASGLGGFGGALVGSGGQTSSTTTGGGVGHTNIPLHHPGVAKAVRPNTPLSIAHSVALDGSGAVAVGGDFLEPIDLGGGTLSNSGAFVARYDASGGYVWGKAFGAPKSSSSVRFIAFDGAGNTLVAGPFLGD